jgi:hypothetical protein
MDQLQLNKFKLEILSYLWVNLLIDIVIKNKALQTSAKLSLAARKESARQDNANECDTLFGHHLHYNSSPHDNHL